jgi:hypothetical protein
MIITFYPLYNYHMQNFTSQVLSEQLEASHGLLGMVLSDVTNEIAEFTPPGIANTIASTYAHIIMIEDFFAHNLLQNKKSLYESDWKDKTGINETPPMDPKNSFPEWITNQKIDIEQMNKYAAAVFKASEEYIKSLSEEDLQNQISLDIFGMGPRPVTFLIGSIMINNLNTHTGEISAIKGIQGLKGYPN